MKKIIATDKAPQAIGPYSQAVQVPCSNMIFCSGQVAIDPATKKLTGNSAKEQCRQVLDNLQQVLKAAGSDLSQVVRTTIYLSDLADFAAVNEVYATYFQNAPPARATVQVARLPLNAMVEIDAIAMVQ